MDQQYKIWMIVKKDNMRIIGDAGFKGEPNENGSIEVGYGIVDDQRKKGYGFEVTEALIKWAFAQYEVRSVRADCLVEDFGSIKLLEKIGIQK